MNTTVSSPLGECWLRFGERLRSVVDRLLTELEGCWQDVQRLLEEQARSAQSFSMPAFDSPDLRAVQAARADRARTLLHEPISQWERRQPMRRALMALEIYDRSVGDVIRTLPEAIPIAGPELIAALGVWGPRGWRRWVIALKRRRRSRPVRSLVEAALRYHQLRRLDLEDRYFLLLVEAFRSLREPWEASRAAFDAEIAGHPPAGRDAQRERWMTRRRELIQRGEVILSEWRQWSEAILPRVAARLTREFVWSRRPRSPDVEKRRASHRTHWVDQMRAAETELQLERHWEQTEDRFMTSVHNLLENAARERTDLLSELEEAIAWIRRHLEQKGEEEFPAPRASLAPAMSRWLELEAEWNGALQALPALCELRARFSSAPRRRIVRRRLRPREVLRQTLWRRGRSEVLRILEEIESHHREIVQEIERAREVVTFALEVTVSEHEDEAQVVREALQNALSLLEYRRRETPDWQRAASARLARMLASVFLEARMIFSRHRLGVLAYFAQQGLRRAVALASRSAAIAAVQFLRHLVGLLERLALRFLIAIGWKPAPTEGTARVIVRPLLPEEFTLDLMTKDLPALYRRLFRFEPVQDPRFLVGRQRELAAIAEARALWEAGRPISLLIVGQRGSGKTSLINCALKRALDGLDVIRGEFTERLTTEAQLREFLAALIGAPDVAQVEEVLLARRRVVILEELERTFLRQVGYYGAIRALQRVITATCSSTLWIFTINDVAFRLLDAVVSLGASFSHRLAIGTATRDDLRQAILLRHNLSGLRIQFPEPPSPRGLLARLKGLLQGPVDPETFYFEALARESGGSYRAAFEIWLGHIEAVEAGVLYLKPVMIPDLSPVIEDLDLSDLFTLVAILQHGSLTPEEHAVVFQTSTAASRSQIDELLAREIIEQDPGRPGFRVRPEALRVAVEALYRRNLL